MQNLNRFEALEVCQITFQRDSEGEGEVRKTLFSSQKREFQQVIKSEPIGIFNFLWEQVSAVSAPIISKMSL